MLDPDRSSPRTGVAGRAGTVAPVAAGAGRSLSADAAPAAAARAQRRAARLPRLYVAGDEALRLHARRQPGLRAGHREPKSCRWRSDSWSRAGRSWASRRCAPGTCRWTRKTAPPLRPFADVAELEDGTARIFAKVDPALGADFEKFRQRLPGSRLAQRQSARRLLLVLPQDRPAVYLHERRRHRKRCPHHAPRGRPCLSRAGVERDPAAAVEPGRADGVQRSRLDGDGTAGAAVLGEGPGRVLHARRGRSRPAGAVGAHRPVPALHGGRGRLPALGLRRSARRRDGARTWTRSGTSSGPASWAGRTGRAWTPSA